MKCVVSKIDTITDVHIESHRVLYNPDKLEGQALWPKTSILVIICSYVCRNK